MKLRWFRHVKRRYESNILKSVMELEVEGRRPVGWPTKTWSKVVEVDMRKLNTTVNEDNNDDEEEEEEEE